MRTFIVPALAALLALGACGQKPVATAQAPATPGPKLTASFQELMLSEVDPAADALWESVGTVSDATGIHESRPRTQEDWDNLRHHMVTLSEAMNLLTMDGRIVVHPGQKLEDEGADGNLTAAQIQEKLKTEKALLKNYALTAQTVALRAIDHIDKKNVDGIVEVGGELDAACEACHTHFWYPGAAQQ